MAIRRRRTAKNAKTRGSRGSQAIVVFWLVFIIVIISIFIANYDTIGKNFGLFKERMSSSPDMEEDSTVVEIVEPPPQPIREQLPVPDRSTPTPPSTEQRPQPDTPAEQRPATTDRPATPPTPPPRPPAPPPVETRERSVYFAQIDRDGQILQSKVSRRIPVSASPMQDALNTILAGPSADELARGVVNLIPQNTRILSATIRGNTAYISFSEDFMFNTFGVEGYVAQLRQIVWTVTEFQNIRDVQILIEGRRLDYLGEGIWIGSPIGRQSF
ncbi:MAG: GerMN domain-containing protein [Treponema sp.]|nr:GerMN domain-containing protein [Treponema sp.]